MSTLDYGPLEDFKVIYANDVDAPHDVSVILLDPDGEETIGHLSPMAARKLAYGILLQIEEGLEEQRSKLMYGELVSAGIVPPRDVPPPNLTVV